MITGTVLKGKIIDFLRKFLYLIIPVKKDKIIFQSSPDYSDNARAFSDYLLENTDYKLLWVVENKHLFPESERIRFINDISNNNVLDKLKYIYHTLSSQFLFSTHGSFAWANKRKQTFVCLWHGMPLKKIAVWQNPRNKNYISNAAYILSTSKFYVPIIAKCFGRSEEEILPLGYPRNDWLFKESHVLNDLGIDLQDGEKLILYLPTFRKPAGDSYKDSSYDSFKSDIVDFRTDEKLTEINEYLKHLGVKMLIKPHPAESGQLDYKKLSNVLRIPHRFFVERDIQLNQVMHYADAIITDFSGAYCDFMNLDRPIGFVLSDFSEYEENRGFVFDDILKYLAGDKIYTEEQFKRFCTDVASGKDYFKNERHQLKHVFNDYPDSNNCQRLAERLGLRIKTQR